MLKIAAALLALAASACSLYVGPDSEQSGPDAQPARLDPSVPSSSLEAPQPDACIPHCDDPRLPGPPAQCICSDGDTCTTPSQVDWCRNNGVCHQ